MADGHPGDVAAVWDVKLVDGIHKIVFEHGTSSGKRVITVDGVEVSLSPALHPESYNMLLCCSFSGRIGCFDL